MGEITRGREAGVVATRAAAFVIGEMLHLVLQRLQCGHCAGDLGAKGVVVVGGQRDGGRMATIGTSTSSRPPPMMAVRAQPDSFFFGVGRALGAALAAALVA